MSDCLASALIAGIVAIATSGFATYLALASIRNGNRDKS